MQLIDLCRWFVSILRNEVFDLNVILIPTVRLFFSFLWYAWFIWHYSGPLFLFWWLNIIDVWFLLEYFMGNHCVLLLRLFVYVHFFVSFVWADYCIVIFQAGDFGLFCPLWMIWIEGIVLCVSFLYKEAVIFSLFLSTRMPRGDSFPLLFVFWTMDFMKALCVFKYCKKIFSSSSTWGHTENTSLIYYSHSLVLLLPFHEVFHAYVA